ncbi:hypothetical protein [Leptolyngbya phage Lbo-JY12]
MTRYPSCPIRNNQNARDAYYLNCQVITHITAYYYSVSVWGLIPSTHIVGSLRDYNS